MLPYANNCRWFILKSLSFKIAYMCVCVWLLVYSICSFCFNKLKTELLCVAECVLSPPRWCSLNDCHILLIYIKANFLTDFIIICVTAQSQMPFIIIDRWNVSDNLTICMCCCFGRTLEVETVYINIRDDHCNRWVWMHFVTYEFWTISSWWQTCDNFHLGASWFMIHD